MGDDIVYEHQTANQEKMLARFATDAAYSLGVLVLQHRKTKDLEEICSTMKNLFLSVNDDSLFPSRKYEWWKNNLVALTYITEYFRKREEDSEQMTERLLACVSAIEQDRGEETRKAAEYLSEIFGIISDKIRGKYRTEEIVVN